jgi:hypothetical protein
MPVAAHPVLARLQGLAVDTLTPRAALSLLYELHEAAAAAAAAAKR